MSANALALVIQAGGESTWQGILEDVPHDPAALFVYALLGVALFFIWKGRRPKQGAGPR